MPDGINDSRRWLASVPFAHRGLHGEVGAGTENSLSAVRAAIAQGYGIEIDVQPSADGVPMVFHDPDLSRMTGRSGAIWEHAAAELAPLRLAGTEDTIVPLATILGEVGDRVPILVEIKEDHPSPEAFTERVGELLAAYKGRCAAMSFSPDIVTHLARVAPNVPRGFVSYDYRGRRSPPAEERRARAELRVLERAPVDFVSYGVHSLPSPHVETARQRGVVINCWTVRTAAEHRTAQAHADTMTFEGFLP